MVRSDRRARELNAGLLSRRKPRSPIFARAIAPFPFPLPRLLLLSRLGECLHSTLVYLRDMLCASLKGAIKSTLNFRKCKEFFETFLQINTEMPVNKQLHYFVNS